MRARLYVSLLAIPALIAASAAANLTTQPGSKVWVTGTSSVRSYRCESTQVEGTAQANTTDLSQLSSIPGGTVTVAVASLDCRNGTMNGHMRNALKATENPTLRFRATEITVSGGRATMNGQLTIAGNTQPATFEGTVTSEGGEVRVQGTRQINMTTFGVRPPSLMMGTMKVHPPVTIGFDVVLKP